MHDSGVLAITRSTHLAFLKLPLAVPFIINNARNTNANRVDSKFITNFQTPTADGVRKGLVF